MRARLNLLQTLGAAAALCLLGGLGMVWAGGSTDASTTGEPPTVEVEISPDRLVWTAGETVSGIYTVRNVGTSAARWPSPYLGTVELKRADRSEAKLVRPPPVGYCGCDGSPPPMVLRPGEKIRRRFDLGTDPLAERGGYAVEDARHQLVFNPEPVPNAPVLRSRPAFIEFRTQSAERIGRRIIFAAASGERLAVLRESGEVAWHRLSDGGRIASAKVEGFDLGWSQAPGRLAFSDDASVFAHLASGSIPQFTPATLGVYVLRDGVVERFSTPLAGAAANSWRDCIGAVESDAGHVVVSDVRSSLLRIDWRGGEVLKLGCETPRPPNSRRPCVSPSGAFASWVGDESVTVWRAGVGAESASFTVSCPRDGRVWLAHGGLIVPDTSGKSLQIWSYDGVLATNLKTDALEFEADSRDGRYVATHSIAEHRATWDGLAGRLEIWDREAGEKLYSIDDGTRRRAMILGDAGLVVCAVVHTEVGHRPWLEERFEVRDLRTGRLVQRLDLQP